MNFIEGTTNNFVQYSKKDKNPPPHEDDILWGKILSVCTRSTGRGGEDVAQDSGSVNTYGRLHG